MVDTEFLFSVRNKSFTTFVDVDFVCKQGSLETIIVHNIDPHCAAQEFTHKSVLQRIVVDQRVKTNTATCIHFL